MHPLHRYLRAKGLTQSQLAARAGTDQGSISKFIRGVAWPSWDTAKRLAEATGGVVGALEVFEYERPARKSKRSA